MLMIKLSEEARDDMVEAFENLDPREAAVVVMDLYSNVAPEFEDICFYEMASFNEMFDGVKPIELLEEIVQPFDTDADFFVYTVYGCEAVDADTAMEKMCERSGDIIDKVIQYVEADGHDISHWPSALFTAMGEFEVKN